MDGITRRSFLKFCVASAAIAAVPASAKALLIPAEEKTPENYIDMGYIRELSAYDIRFNSTIYRYDITDGKKQCGIDTRIYGKNPDKEARKQAVDLLLSDASKELDMNNLIKLPIPG